MKKIATMFTIGALYFASQGCALYMNDQGGSEKDNLESKMKIEKQDEMVKGRMILAPEAFDFPAYANLEWKSMSDSTTYLLKTDHMGIVQYNLPSGNYLVSAEPSKDKHADLFKPFTTTIDLSPRDSSKFGMISPNGYQ